VCEQQPTAALVLMIRDHDSKVVSVVLQLVTTASSDEMAALHSAPLV
jgi:hypothetical protein